MGKIAVSFEALNDNSLIAQLVERRTVNPQVPGSSPGRGAKLKKRLGQCPRRFLFLVQLSWQPIRSNTTSHSADNPSILLRTPRQCLRYKFAGHTAKNKAHYSGASPRAPTFLAPSTPQSPHLPPHRLCVAWYRCEFPDVQALRMANRCR